jgi:hypothetical protein
MMNKVKTSGAILATVVGLMFAAQPVLAQDNSSQSSQANVKCLGGNSCKGQSACQTAQSGCKGQNSCKGKGWITTASVQECTQKGGHVESN